MRKLRVSHFVFLSLTIHAASAFILRRAPAVEAHARHGAVAVELIATQPTPTPAAPPRSRGTRARAAKTKTPPPPARQTESMDSRSGRTGDLHGSASAPDMYLSKIIDLLNKNKIYPQAAVVREQEGRVILTITLAADGTVLDSSVETPSPFRLLNEAALQTIRNSGRFPEPPTGVEAPMRLHIPMVFTIER